MPPMAARVSQRQTAIQEPRTVLTMIGSRLTKISAGKR